MAKRGRSARARNAEASQGYGPKGLTFGYFFLSHSPLSKCPALIPELSKGGIPEHLSSGPCLVGGWGLRQRERCRGAGEGGRGTWGKSEKSAAWRCLSRHHSQEDTATRACLPLTAPAVSTGDTDVLKNKEGCLLP